MASYTVTGREWTSTTGSGGTEWIHVYSTNQTAVVEGDHWRFNISAYVANTGRVDINYWSVNGGTSYINIRFYSDSARTQLIGSGSTPISGSFINSSEGKTAILATATATGAADVDKVYVTVELDARGVNPPYGILYNSQGYYINKMVEYGVFDVEDIKLTQPPVIANLINDSELKVDNGVSVSKASKTIVLAWKRTGGSAITESYYSLDNGNTWTRTVNANGAYTKISANISGLTGNNTYTIKIRSKNSAGYSNILSITIRTRHPYPTLGLELNSRGLESLVYKWTSNKSLASTSYKIDDGDWVSLGQTGTSGTFTVKWFNPNTTHTVYFKGTSTAAYDSREGSEKSASGTTYDIAHITKLGEYTFGLPISLDIENVSGKSLSLQIKASGNSRTPTFTLTNASAGTYTFTPTQDQLDQMYKCFTNTNSINIEFTLTTIGDNKKWADTSQTKVLTLTGIAKTAHFGVSNKPRRAQAWVGINGTPRRAVVWVGVNNTPRRCI